MRDRLVRKHCGGKKAAREQDLYLASIGEPPTAMKAWAKCHKKWVKKTHVSRGVRALGKIRGVMKIAMPGFGVADQMLPRQLSPDRLMERAGVPGAKELRQARDISRGGSGIRRRDFRRGRKGRRAKPAPAFAGMVNQVRSDQGFVTTGDSTFLHEVWAAEGNIATESAAELSAVRAGQDAYSKRPGGTSRGGPPRIVSWWRRIRGVG